jgi:tetratricopeptide (TPR) repeat protein
MSTAKLDRLRAYAESHAQDPFAWYAVAMELKSLNRLDEAVPVFERLMTEFPAYVPSYLQAGFTLQAAGNQEAARAAYQNGVQAARQAGNTHAASELQGALDSLDE